MFQPWRLKLREADEALRAGRLEEASRLLCESGVRDFLPARRMLADVAGEMVQRAKRRVTGGQSAAGWRDLETARSLGADAEALAAVKGQFIAHRLAEAQGYLAAGDPAAAIARLDELTRQGAGTRQVRQLREVASKLLAANRFCRRGEFAQADEELAAAAALAPDLKELDAARQACTVKAAESRRLTEQLHEALASQDWTAVLRQAEALFELCPEHEPARDARRRAWAAVGMSLAGSPSRPPAARRLGQPAELPNPPEKGKLNGHARCPARPDANHRAEVHPVNAEPLEHAGPAGRFLLWVDGVGGYLVCQADEVVVGQPVPGSDVDIPILGDISRRHARIRRDGENYLIDPLRPLCLDGRQVTEVSLLADGNLIELGGNVRLKFRRPHPLSATARLEFVSHHRTQPASDGVLLLAESCVLGPAAASHIACRDWTHEVVIFRQAGHLYCRAPGFFQVDGVRVEGRGLLQNRSQVVGDEFSLSIEEL